MIIGNYMCLDCKINSVCKHSDVVSKFETKIPVVISINSCPSFLSKDEEEDDEE